MPQKQFDIMKIKTYKQDIKTKEEQKELGGKNRHLGK